MKYLADVTDLPFMAITGRVIAKPGYDPETCHYIHLPLDWHDVVPEAPTAAQVRAAVAEAMRPWRGYSFATPDDSAAMVSAVLAAIVRPSLDLCPAYLFDASQPGSGKTRAACSLGALIEGRRPAVTPFAGASTDDELRKRMVAGAIDGVRFHCVDNVVGHLKSSALAAVLTGGRLTDRVLGQSRTVTANVRALVTLTANNASMESDLQRRTAKGERPAVPSCRPPMGS